MKYKKDKAQENAKVAHKRAPYVYRYAQTNKRNSLEPQCEVRF